MHTITKICQYTVVLLVVSFLIWGTDQNTNVLTLFHTATAAIALPIITDEIHAQQKITVPVAFLVSSYKAGQKIQTLERANNRLRAENTEIAQLQSENTALRQALNAQLPQYKPIIGTAFMANNQMVVVVPANTPIRTGAFVVQQHYLIGQIASKRGADLYEVMPTTSASFIAKVQVLHNGTPVDGLIEGQYTTTMHLTNVLSSAEIGVNDLVILHDPEKALANDFVVGKIAKINHNDTAVFQDASVAPLANVSADPTVFIMQQQGGK